MVMLLRFYKNIIYMRKNCLPSGFNRVPLIIETYINGAVDAVMTFTAV
jgi:hypothetical protein